MKMAITLYQDRETEMALASIESKEPSFNRSAFWKKCLLELDGERETDQKALIEKNLKDAIAKKQLAENDLDFWLERRKIYDNSIKEKQSQLEKDDFDNYCKLLSKGPRGYPAMAPGLAKDVAHRLVSDFIKAKKATGASFTQAWVDTWLADDKQSKGGAP